MTPELLARVEGRAGRITLNRPKVLNALNQDMVSAMTRALQAWTEDPAVDLVIVDAAGDRAFCAGGDIQLIYRSGRSEPEQARRFWYDEYRLNTLIRHYAKPYVAIMDGIVMGGGVGISAHGSHRIVCERSSVTMPEVSIGFLPDIGGTWLLSRAPGETGMHLGLTAATMNPGDAIYAGFADSYVPRERLASLIQALVDKGDPAVVAEFADPTPASPLSRQRSLIDVYFGHRTLLEIVRALEQSPGSWENQTLKALRRVSPFSAATTFEAIKRARCVSDLEPCLVNEYRLACRCLEGRDFYEGVRAAVIDKDRKPNWSPARIEDISPISVMAAFEPLPDDADWRPLE